MWVNIGIACLQVARLLRALCQLYKLDVPNEIAALSDGECSSASAASTSSAIPVDVIEIDDEMDDETSTGEVTVNDDPNSEQDTELDDNLFVVT